jgi:hypothetical protein
VEFSFPQTMATAGQQEVLFKVHPSLPHSHTTTTTFSPPPGAVACFGHPIVG